nr:putative capsid [Marmot picobirnavirus]
MNGKRNNQEDVVRGGNNKNRPSKGRKGSKKSWEKNTEKRGRMGRDNKQDSGGHVVGNYVHNDPSWYEPYPGANQDVAQLSFGNALGMPHNLGGIAAEVNAFPGIMVLPFTPVPGISVEGDRESPISTATNAFYTTVRYAQGVAGNYDSSDLMCYPLVGDACYTFWAYCRRLYGVVNAYSVSNRYLSRALVESMGVDFENIRSNLYDFIGWLNDFAYQMGSLCMPDDFTAFKRHMRMCENIYVDGTTSKAQMYVYVPKYLWAYDELANEEFGLLKATQVWTSSDTRRTFEDLRNIGASIINSIKHSSTMMNMAGDIKRAYGDGALMKIPYTEIGYTAPIIYDEEQVMEIQNTLIVGEPLNQSSPTGAGYFGVKAMRGTNTLVFDPMMKKPLMVLSEHYLNIRNDAPTADQIMRATRCAVAYDTVRPAAAGGQAIYLLTCGTELVHELRLYYYRTNPTDNMLQLVNYQINSWAVQQGSVDEMTLHKLEKFDYHPYIYIFTPTDVSESYEFSDIAGDVDNVTWYGPEFLYKLNRYAVLGEYKSPQMGTFFKR